MIFQAQALLQTTAKEHDHGTVDYLLRKSIYSLCFTKPVFIIIA